MSGAWQEGSGLLGLKDRLCALEGRLRVGSPAADDTLVAAAIPLSALASSQECRGATAWKRVRTGGTRTQTGYGDL